MATKTQTPEVATPAVKTVKVKKTPPTLVERMKSQLSAAALRSKITVDELAALEGHIARLKALLA